MVQMAGGEYTMDYNQETAYYKGHCLAHDAVDIFNMIADCALEPKSHVQADIGMWMNNETHKLEDLLKTGVEFNNNIFRAAFGNTGLGMPLKGYKGNVDNLIAQNLQKFQIDNYSPEKIFIGASGVVDHSEFVDLAESILCHIPKVQGTLGNKRESTVYTGGEVKNLKETNDIHIALLLPSVSWNSADVVAFKVAEKLLQSVQGRIAKNVLQKHSFVDSANALNFNFSDAGLFGVKLSGAAHKANDILNVGIDLLKSFSKISQPELQAAKNSLKIETLLAMERPEDRLEETLYNVFPFFIQVKTLGKVVHQNYTADIDNVTGDQISKLFSNMLKQKATLVCEGGNVSTLPSYDAVLNALSK